MASGEGSVFENAEDGQQVMSAISTFAFELYKQQLKKCSENIFMSPLSISDALSMAYLGARGNTWAEMKKTLRFSDLDDCKLHQAFHDIVTYLKRGKVASRGDQIETLFQVSIANRLYAQKSYTFLDEFQTSCRKFYDAEMANVDFVDDQENAVKQINSWVAENTNQKITDIIAPEFINSYTKLVLVNAIYFKSAWDKKFDPNFTKDSEFFGSPGNATKVRMMFLKADQGQYCYSDDLKCQILKLPYRKKLLSMLIFLPDKAFTSLEEMENKLTSDHLAKVDNILQFVARVEIWLPKFKVEEQLKLEDVLCDMGMKDLFHEGSANLSGMDGTKKLFASKVLHKAYINVNEEGTEATCATAMAMQNRRGIFSRDPPIEFRADHPFLFFIREETTKAILFIGRIKKPHYS